MFPIEYSSDYTYEYNSLDDFGSSSTSSDAEVYHTLPHLALSATRSASDSITATNGGLASSSMGTTTMQPRRKHRFDFPRGVNRSALAG